MSKILGLGLTVLLLASPALADDAAVPMLGNSDGVWGELKLQYRARPELRENGDLDAGSGDTLLFGLQRARIGASLNYQDWVSGFVQVQDARMAGFANSSVAYTGNTDLHQAWVKIGLPGSVSLKLGRQQLVYGDQRLVGHLEWANQGRVFEAAKLSWKHGLGFLDGFSAVFTPGPNGNLLDATHFSGLYDSLQFFDGALVWDQYLFSLVDTGQALPAGQRTDPTAEEQPDALRRQIMTLGTRVRYNGFGIKGGIEAAGQFGYLDVDSGAWLHAHALHGDLAYTIAVPTSPSIGVEVNYGLGDDADTETTSERFINLFPTNHLHYGFMDLQNWSNAFNGALHLKLKLWKGVGMGLSYWLLARASADDSWTSAGGKVLLASDPAAPGDHADELLLGHEVDASVKWKVNKHLVWASGLSTFVPTGFALDKGSDPQVWGFTMLVVSL